jgi:hypothetical protein
MNAVERVGIKAVQAFFIDAKQTLNAAFAISRLLKKSGLDAVLRT